MGTPDTDNLHLVYFLLLEFCFLPSSISSMHFKAQSVYFTVQVGALCDFTVFHFRTPDIHHLTSQPHLPNLRSELHCFSSHNILMPYFSCLLATEAKAHGMQYFTQAGSPIILPIWLSPSLLSILASYLVMFLYT